MTILRSLSSSLHLRSMKVWLVAVLALATGIQSARAYTL